MFLVDELLFESSSFVILLLKPGLFLDDELFLSLLEIFLVLGLFLVDEFFAQSMSFRVLALLD